MSDKFSSLWFHNENKSLQVTERNGEKIKYKIYDTTDGESVLMGTGESPLPSFLKMFEMFLTGKK